MTLNPNVSRSSGVVGLISCALSFIWNRKLEIIVVAGAVLYIGYIFSGFDQVLFYDEHEYLTIARNIISTGTYAFEPGVPTASRPPGYLAFVTPIVALGLTKPGIVFAQAILWGASVYLAGLISYRLRGPPAGALAILFGLLYPLFGFITVTVYPQILTAFFLLLFVWGLLKEPGKLPSAGTAGFVGIMMGLTILVSPILVPVLLAMLFFQVFLLPPFFSLQKFRPAIIAFLVACCVILPWIGRNWVVMGAPSISTIVGFNLLYGNSENATPEAGTAVNIERYEAAVRGMNEIETDRALRDFAIDWICSNPEAAAKLYVGKFVQFFAYKEVLRTRIAGLELLQKVIALAYYPMLLLSILGVIYFAATGSSRGEIVLFLGYFVAAAAHAVFVQRLRYRAEVDFLIVIIAANFVAALLPAALRPADALATVQQNRTAA